MSKKVILRKAVQTLKEVIKSNPTCNICGGSGQVLRAYVEPEVGMPRALDKVLCPRCSTFGKGEKNG